MQYYGTLGPACGRVKILEKMLEAGMTGVRLNMSHGNLDENGQWLQVLALAVENCRTEKPQVLIDLQGPELRLGKLSMEYDVEEDQLITIGIGGLPVPQMLLDYAQVGDRILLDDGKLEFEVESLFDADGEKNPNPLGVMAMSARVVRGGTVKSGKSLAIVGKELPMPTLTENDKKNIGLAKEYGVTGVMQPFVRNKEDLQAVRAALKEAGAEDVKIFAKIENTQGVAALEELLPYCDHIVIARGDLGNAMPLWELPRVQKEIAEKCRKAGKPFMVVTQMLDSMHHRAVPTRAEVLDIFNAVLDGASSLMLTGETAAGMYPVESMEYLVKTGNEGLGYSCL